MSRTDLEVRALGPLEVLRSGTEVPLGGPRQRLVLACLVMVAGRAVPAERLVDEIWGDEAPTVGSGPLRTYIWQLRRLLEPGGEPARGTPGRSGGGLVAAPTETLVSRSGSYLLDIDREQIDAVRFEQLFTESRAAAASGRAERALTRLDEALWLWRGPAFGDLAAEPAIQPEAARLEQLRVGARELRAEMLLATGQHLQVADEIGGLARVHPERERLWAMLMTALYRSGRQGDALRCFQEARATLIEDAGLEPGPELRGLEEAILRQDPDLDWHPAPAPPLPAPPLQLMEEVADDRSDRLAHLPPQLTSFIGRRAELAEIASALVDSRLLTLHGTGGCGKTRLALAVAEDVTSRFPEGVWFVDLSAVSDPALVARAVAEPLGVGGDKIDQVEQVACRIGNERVLLVLDNCEHVVETAAELAQVLLERCPALHILATSREELRIAAETVWRVPALSLPGERFPGRSSDGDDVLTASEAVQLFVERGRSALPGFAPTGQSLDTVAQICCRLDGIALAVELAAALVGSLPVGDIANRLDNQLSLFEVGRRQGAERHRTLRATLDWSYDLLDEPSRELLVRLGVFVGDFTLAAAEKVAAADPSPLAMARGLGHLVRTSMVTVVAGSDGTERYRLLETIRQYAREKLEQLEDFDEIQRRHALYYANLATEADRHVHGPAASEWLARLISELPNLRTAVAWAISRDEVEIGVRLISSLNWYVARMNLLDETSQWLDAWLPRRQELAPELRLKALTSANSVAFTRGDFTRTRDLSEEAIGIARQLDDPQGLATALMMRGGAAVYQGALERAEQCFEEARLLFDRLGDRWGLAWMLMIWGVGSRRSGDLARARSQLAEALGIFRGLDDRHGQVFPLINLALVAQSEGQVKEALERATEAVDLAVSVGERQQQHVAVCVLGGVELSLAHYERARDLLVRSIRDFPGAHHHDMLAIALEGMARLASLAGHHEDAVALLAFTKASSEQRKITLSADRTQKRDEPLEGALAEIGPDLVASEVARGEAMYIDEAIRLAEARTMMFASEPEPFEANQSTDTSLSSKEVLLHELRDLAAQKGQVELQMDELVPVIRQSGGSWREVGLAVGMSAQGAYRRWTEAAKEQDRVAKAKLREKARANTSQRGVHG